MHVHGLVRGKSRHQAPTAVHGVWQEHWFTIRQVAGEFWDFNSLFPAPRPLTPTYLETFLATLREQGYSIFVILGPLPQGSPDQGSGNGALYTPQQVGAWKCHLHPDAQHLPKQARSALHMPFAGADRALRAAVRSWPGRRGP